MANPHVSIIVYKGDPLDYQKYRHTAVFIRRGQSLLLAHIVGAQGAFDVEVRQNHHPFDCATFANQILVGYMTSEVSEAQIVQLAYQYPPDNTDPELNCQTWVGQFLKAMQTEQWLTEEQVDSGIDGMADAIVEAKDEP